MSSGIYQKVEVPVDKEIDNIWALTEAELQQLIEKGIKVGLYTLSVGQAKGAALVPALFSCAVIKRKTPSLRLQFEPCGGTEAAKETNAERNAANFLRGAITKGFNAIHKQVEMPALPTQNRPVDRHGKPLDEVGEEPVAGHTGPSEDVKELRQDLNELTAAVTALVKMQAAQAKPAPKKRAKRKVTKKKASTRNIKKVAKKAGIKVQTGQEMLEERGDVV